MEKMIRESVATIYSRNFENYSEFLTFVEFEFGIKLSKKESKSIRCVKLYLERMVADIQYYD